MSSHTQELTKASYHPGLPFKDFGTGHLQPDSGDNAGSESELPNHKVYLIEPDSGLRARLARLVLATGFHVEIFGSVAEFLSYAPEEGVIFVNDSIEGRGVAGVMDILTKARVLMPVVAYRDQPSIGNVIAALRAKVTNFLPIEYFESGLKEVLALAAVEVESGRDRRCKVTEAHKRVSRLTNRERQVLEMVAEGLSNKEIARTLDISPRTVEIHRMKMMAKMAARSSSEAVRIWCSAAAYH